MGNLLLADWWYGLQLDWNYLGRKCDWQSTKNWIGVDEVETKQVNEVMEKYKDNCLPWFKFNQFSSNKKSFLNSFPNFFFSRIASVDVDEAMTQQWNLEVFLFNSTPPRFLCLYIGLNSRWLKAKTKRDSDYIGSSTMLFGGRGRLQMRKM
jgi:hypothetical protein